MRLHGHPLATRGRSPTWHDHLVAALATVAVLYGAAFATHDLAVVAGVEGLRGQALVALSAAEAALVPVAVLVVQLLQHTEDACGLAAASPLVCSSCGEG